MRFSFKKCLIIFFLMVLIKAAWDWMTLISEEKYTQTCNQLESYQNNLHAVTDSVHKILYKLEVTHFLCYGSLWGQIRLSRLLPWEEKSVLCLLNEDISAKDEVLIVRLFKKEGLYITYDATQGQYVVTKVNGDKKMRVLLVLFELDVVILMYRRIGWLRRVLPPSCDIQMLDCFPPGLITPPLPMKEFGGNLIPVPKEGIEIQKYHFQDNWWKEIPTKNC